MEKLKCSIEGAGTPRRTFFDLFSRGEVSADQIDDYIEAWHEGAGKEASLHEYLGLTWPEYQQWAEDAGSLHQILAHRREASGDFYPT
jgi:hypothetical protein